MKIATFHKIIQNDYVLFIKGELPSNMANTKWDRIYVTSLFTFEWAETIAAIKYAQTLVDSNDKIIVGGIAATLMSEQIYEATGIQPVCGLLNEPNKIGLLHDECIDQLVPDYSILEDIEYVYPSHNAYFLSSTKGCGMKCGFCAVQTLEPFYVPHQDIITKIEEIDKKYDKKKDLLLMDNNVLRSNRFEEIINDIIAAGFEKGATYTNPKTKKIVRRYVDFNQGLDANLLTPEKAELLGRIALRPARIAFDHIEDRDTYERAIRLCAENGITELSNYILYNSEEFTGKGKTYVADSPEDLYTRMRITLDLKEEINETLEDDSKIDIFSFPMRYVPLSAQERGYVGPKWNSKFLRSVQCMLIPTQGKGVGSRSFFEADFGRNPEEFIRFLCMPEKLIAARGDIALGVRGRKGETEEQLNERQEKWEKNQVKLNEWNRLFNELQEERNEFIEQISDNEYLPEKLLGLRTSLQQKLYIHYLTVPRIFSLLGMLDAGSPTRNVVKDYITIEFPAIYEGLLSLLVTSETQHQFIFKHFIEFFGREGLISLLTKLEPNGYKADKQMAIWSKVCKKIGFPDIDFELIRIYKRYTDLGILIENDDILARNAITNLNMGDLGQILMIHFNDFRNKVSQSIEGEKGEQILLKISEKIFGSIQIKLSDIIQEGL